MKTLLLAPPEKFMMDPRTGYEDLIRPKTWVPLGIAYLASSLRAAGHTAEIRDLHDFTWLQVSKLLRALAPDVVGITCFTMNRANALRLASLVKKELPASVVIMGGPHATFFPEHILQNPAVDIVALGQGEETLVEVIAALQGNGDLRQIQGLVFRKGEELVRTEARQQFPALDSLPFPAYDAFDLDEYKSLEIPPQYLELTGTHMLTSRGCPFHCHFCSVHDYFGSRWHARSPENVLDEVQMLMETRAVEHIYFSDDIFSLDQKRVITLCKMMLDRGLRLPWMAETRVDCVSGEMLAWMRKAGCYRIYYGVESGSPRILKAMNKGFSVEQIRQAFEMTHAAGMQPCCFLMVGNPGESPETIRETIDLIHTIKPARPPIIGINCLFPGTEHYTLAQRQGIISDEYWISDLPPPLFTLEHSSDDLIYLQMQLAQEVCPEQYGQMRRFGMDENYFRQRRLSLLEPGEA